MTTSPSTESPRNSSRSLLGSPPASYAYERWVRARTSTARPPGRRSPRWRWSSSSLTGRAAVLSAPDEADPLPMRAGSALVLGALGGAVVTALVGATGRAGHVRLGERLALGAGRRGDRPSPSSWRGASGCWSATSSASEQPRQFLFSSAWPACSARPAAPPIGGRSLRAGAPGPPRGARRTRSTAPGSPPGIPAGTAVKAPPCPGAPARGRSDRPRAGAPRSRRPRPPPHGGGRALGVDEQLLEGPVDLVADGVQAPHAGAGRRATDRTGDEHALDDGLQPELEGEGLALLDAR